MRAINNYVILKKSEEGENITPGGIVFVESRTHLVSVGEVVSAPESYLYGDGEYKTPVSVGDKVLYSPGAAIEYKGFLLYPIHNIYAVLE